MPSLLHVEGYCIYIKCKMTESDRDVPCKVMKTEEWVERWDRQAIGFHKDHIHPLLKKHISVLLNGRSNIKIFFPLCGKAVDMKWLADEGHTIVGVEAAQKAIEEFFTEQNVPYTTQPAPTVNGTLFQSEDKKLNLYCCDFYRFSKDVVGQVDGVWDRGGLVAINVDDRERYVSITKSLMAPGCRYLLSALEYDETKYGGPPHHLSRDAVCQLFEETCNVEQIDEADSFEPRHANWGISWLTERVFNITQK